MYHIIENATVEQAQEAILSAARPRQTEIISLNDALYRVLAQPIKTDIDHPPFDRAMMDGYAVHSSDVDSRWMDGSAVMSVRGLVTAGREPGPRLQGGQAVQINTGAPIPDGADSIVRVEDTDALDERSSVRINRRPAPGQHIDPQGRHVRAGSVVVNAGVRMGASEIAVCAAAGAAKIPVYRIPRVALLVTGDELVDASIQPIGSQLRNSNLPMLSALARQEFATSLELGIAPDDLQSLKSIISRGLANADVLCISGGVSMGTHDLVPDALAACDVQLRVRKVKVKPGKPMLFGMTSSGALVFGLVGNPAGCFVGFHLFVRPAIQSMSGHADVLPPVVSARLSGQLAVNADRPTYLPAIVRVCGDGLLSAETLKWGGSGDPFGLSESNALVIRPPAAPVASDGESIEALLLNSIKPATRCR